MANNTNTINLTSTNLPLSLTILPSGTVLVSYLATPAVRGNLYTNQVSWASHDPSTRVIREEAEWLIAGHLARVARVAA